MANLNNLPLNSYILDAAFSDYGNGLAFKQSYTSLDDIWKTDDFWPVLNEHLFSLLIISFKVKIKVYLERATVETYI